MSEASRLMRASARILQDYEIDGKRARELAEEVERLTGTVRRGSAGLAFEDEPSRFLAAQYAGRPRARGGKR
ncbi:MAG: hypothetical protein HY521_11190 [Proteobacteria bacterium]|nr:hypothetical protein [Pseudomonadota bacterium]